LRNPPGGIPVVLAKSLIPEISSLFRIFTLIPKNLFPQQIAGNHGPGVIAKVGKEASLKPGTFVAFSYYNTWAEYAAVPAEWLVPLPSNYPIEKAGQLVKPRYCLGSARPIQSSTRSMVGGHGRPLNGGNLGLTVRQT
jgi:hypothetical protein